MANDSANAPAAQQPPTPSPALRALDVMLGTWDLRGRDLVTDGEIRGRLRFEWLEGGFYLVQHVEIDYVGRKIKGTEYVGYDRESQQLRSYFFSNDGPSPFGGVALEYVWEVDDDTITIWGGYVGSPAKFQGRFDPDRNSGFGRWEWPGGGYEATMTRVRPEAATP